ncbi:putative oligopeptide transporter, OPT family [Lachnospiraceae bacterium A10]|jgi:putative OPT family oligopeptide transporter|nr:putative oligopeptide transporter, OPT family [Lachnospiraceae bacterium A10]
MQEEFKPYIPADEVHKEITVVSVIMGVILAIIFGAANAYLGLRVGMTVSASIPAAVLSMGVIRVILRRDSILENNMVQTIGSAGESLAAGAIFTMPALFLWAEEGKTDVPSMLTITLVALIGGLLGICFMIPLRSALIVKEHGVLPYPEGTACADVLLAGEEGGSSAKAVFSGLGFSALFKLLVDGFKCVGGVVTIPVKAMYTELSAEVYPALLGVGYICGPKIASFMFAGGILGWFVLIPAIVTFGGDSILYPGTDTIANLYADPEGGASAIWSSYIRYIGAGAVATGGIISLIKSLPTIVTTFRDSMRDLKGGAVASNKRTDQDLSMKVVIPMVVVCILAIWLFPDIPVSLLGAILIVIFGFFFATVSSRMVGLVGSSNNPVSGMAIATLLISTFLLKITGDTGAHGMIGAICIGSIICIVAGMAGDMSQDLKTGYIVGATPKKQQIGEIIGSVASALAIGGVLVLLNTAWGFGSTELPAPQAALMKMIVEGIMDGNLPWTFVFIGVAIAITLEILQIPVLPVAIGLYLPLELSSTIMIGGAIRWFIDKKRNISENDETNGGVLFSSGLIAGEGLVGIILAIFAAVGLDIKLPFTTGQFGGVVLLVLMAALLIAAGLGSKKKEA